jgi:hypothetical protein
MAQMELYSCGCDRYRGKICSEAQAIKEEFKAAGGSALLTENPDLYNQINEKYQLHFTSQPAPMVGFACGRKDMRY